MRIAIGAGDEVGGATSCARRLPVFDGLAPALGPAVCGVVIVELGRVALEIMKGPEGHDLVLGRFHETGRECWRLFQG